MTYGELKEALVGRTITNVEADYIFEARDSLLDWTGVGQVGKFTITLDNGDTIQGNPMVWSPGK